MCGITGVFRYDPESRRGARPLEPDRLARMCRTLTHRGPDDEGTHLEKHLGLAMRRLAIIDPEGGKQPLYSESHDTVVVCNGEIYNYRQLREQLRSAGHRFSTNSDCEVLVHLYEAYGLGMLGRLRGMYAFALWDARRERLLIARDRIGIKPLYVADHDGVLVFGSELKAVATSGLVPRRVDPAGLHHYLSLNYVPAPFSMMQGVTQLKPGEYLLCDEQGPQRRTYWDLSFGVRAGSEGEWTRRIRDKLAECVSGHLVSDVPFGAFLSGGIDSSAIVALMAGLCDDPVQTFSIDFNERSYSEAVFARQIAALYGCKHHEVVAEAQAAQLLEELIWYADDPLADSSALPVYLIAEQAKKHVSMVLTGDGGDEVFAGYETYNAHFVRELYRRVPRIVRQQVVRRLVERLPVSLTKVSFDYKAKRFVSGAELDAEEAHFWWRAIFSEQDKTALYSDAFREQLELDPPGATADLYRRCFADSRSDDPLARMLYVDTRLYLPADMLVKVDRMTMANGLEARVPFLDHELVELAAQAPSALKLRRQRKKHLLKEAVADLLPREIIDRKKAGFNVPVNAWLAGELAETMTEILDPEVVEASGFFRGEEVARLQRAHAEREADHSYRLWGLLCFQLWYERFIDADEVSAPETVAQRWY
jgi:asparagine synthase (glutamine-hydrolysing)